MARLVGGGVATTAIRTTRVLDRARRSACLYGRAFYSLKSHVELLLQRVRNSFHLTDLALCRPSSRARRSRQHQLHDPLWRGGPLQHALAQASGRLYTHRVAGWERAGSCQKIFGERRRSNWLPRRGIVAFVLAIVLTAVFLLLDSASFPRLLFVFVFLFLFLGGLFPCLGRFSLIGRCQSRKRVARHQGGGIIIRTERGSAGFPAVPLRSRSGTRQSSSVVHCGHQCKRCTSLGADVVAEKTSRLVLASSSLGDRRSQQTRDEPVCFLYVARRMLKLDLTRVRSRVPLGMGRDDGRLLFSGDGSTPSMTGRQLASRDVTWPDR